MAQPDLDYIAPEIQLETARHATAMADIYSLGMVICACYSQGRSLIQGSHNSAVYLKQVEKVIHVLATINRKIYVIISYAVLHYLVDHQCVRQPMDVLPVVYLLVVLYKVHISDYS